LRVKRYLSDYNCRRCSETLGKGDLDGDGEITAPDIDFAIG
jgi:hypothetical protein